MWKSGISALKLDNRKIYMVHRRKILECIYSSFKSIAFGNVQKREIFSALHKNDFKILYQLVQKYNFRFHTKLLFFRLCHEKIISGRWLSFPQLLENRRTTFNNIWIKFFPLIFGTTVLANCVMYMYMSGLFFSFTLDCVYSMSSLYSNMHFTNIWFEFF